jgi:hypothetical protein
MSRTLVLALVLTFGGGIACGRNGVTVPSSAAPGGTAIPTTGVTASSAAGLVYVDGVITSIDGTAQSFVVRDTTVNVPSTAVIRAGGATVTFADLKIGERVHVRGISTGMGRVTASEIAAEGVPPANTIVVTGAVASLAGTCPSLTFTVGGTTVRTSPTTTFDRGGCAQVVNGRTVRVEGVKQTDGSIQAGRVDLEEVPR